MARGRRSGPLGGRRCPRTPPRRTRPARSGCPCGRAPRTSAGHSVETSDRCARDRSVHRRTRIGEDGEELVAARLDLAAARGVDRLAQEAARVGEELGRTASPADAYEPRRALDVGEEEGDGPGRQRAHARESRARGPASRSGRVRAGAVPAEPKARRRPPRADRHQDPVGQHRRVALRPPGRGGSCGGGASRHRPACGARRRIRLPDGRRRRTDARRRPSPRRPNTSNWKRSPERESSTTITSRSVSVCQ